MKYSEIVNFFFASIVLMLSLLSCSQKIEKVANFCYDIDSCDSKLEFYFGNDSMYSLVFTRNGYDFTTSKVIASGTYKEDNRHYNTKELLSGTQIILNKGMNNLVPQSGMFNRLVFRRTDQSFISSSEPGISDRLFKYYRKSLFIMTSMKKLNNSNFLLHKLSYKDKYYFERENLTLKLKPSNAYELLFNEIIFSSGFWSFEMGKLRFLDKQTGAEYQSFILKDSTFIMGSLPFSTEFNTLKLCSEYKHLLVNPISK